MKKSQLKQVIKEEIQRVLSKIPTIELNTSFLENQEDLENVIDGNFTVWDPKFKNGLKASEQNFESSDKPAIPTQRYPYEMSDNNGEILPYVNVKFKKPLNEVFIDLDDYDPEEFGVEDFDKFDEIVDSKQNPTLQDVSDLIDLNNKDLSFYGTYVLDIKSNEIIKISKVK